MGAEKAHIYADQLAIPGSRQFDNPSKWISAPPPEPSLQGTTCSLIQVSNSDIDSSLRLEMSLASAHHN